MTSPPAPLTQAPGLPLVVELRPAPAIETAFTRLAAQRHALFLDSASRDGRLGRYSFLAADPIEWLACPATQTGIFETWKQRFDHWQAMASTTALPDLPPFQGGWAGLLGYDLNRQLERCSIPKWDEFHVPALAVGLYDVVLAYDHLTDQAWLISQGWPETNPTRRTARAAERLKQFQAWLAAPAISSPHSNPTPLASKDLAPQTAMTGFTHLSSNFSRTAYLKAVESAIEYIYAGDIFQVNLAQRLLYPANDDAVSFYLRLRQRNPAPFAGYLDLGAFQLCSASPERFMQVRDGWVETRPIKGTRRRAGQPEADLFAGDELQTNDKDRAENVMIVDLLRNDLAKVCRADSVCVSQLWALETYAYVTHLVSGIRGELRPGTTGFDLLQAAFPGGSITGAPKPRAMEIIAELEPTARGPYCGALGYLGVGGAMDTNILIRTVTCGRGWWQFPVGGGIVAASQPKMEYEETWHKAEGLLRAIVK